MEIANRTQSIVDGIDVTHQEIKGMFVYKKLFDSPYLYEWILFDIGTQNDLEQKLEEIVCSIGFNTSVMPAEVVTTSPISKEFNFRL